MRIISSTKTATNVAFESSGIGGSVGPSKINIVVVVCKNRTVGNIYYLAYLLCINA
uniref:Uncharacterized protein n=1 Tax=Ascaris lumbricoides TaxID=6252 RepID=A0A0M3IJ16_ASCLU